jgi:CBS domain-containing protein
MKFDNKIKNYMQTDILYITIDERLADVIFKMSRTSTDIAIVKSKNDIVGLITTSDIYSALVKEVFRENNKVTETPRVIEDIKVIDIMRGPPTKKFMTSCQINGANPCIQTDENTSIKDAIRIMDKSGLHHLLVTGTKNKLVGIISSNDIIKNFGKVARR